MPFAIMVSITGIPPTKASVFDWFSGQDANASSSTFGFLTPVLGLNNQSDADNQDNARTPLVQNDYLVSYGSPANSKKITAVQSGNAKATELILFASAYSSTRDQTDEDPFTTAWGTRVHDGIVAANFLPLGTKIKIPEIFGNKIFVVEDRMNRRYWQKIDIWFPNRADALDFGTKKVKIQILNS